MARDPDPDAAIRNLIRDDKIHQIYSTMQTGQEKLGMQTPTSRWRACTSGG
jgi:Tfp pilus assembly pilus retraction ATPase PilT